MLGVNILKKLLLCLLIVTLAFSSFGITASAETDFKMKSFDKAYITFVFDDGNMPFTEECYNIFKAFDMPMCCAVVANRVENNPQVISILKEIEKSGGEILSHTYTHNAFNKNSIEADFIYELKNSYIHLSALGFNINGVIEAGSGGAEKEANYEAMEAVTREYYKYSDYYGVSPQYKKPRTWFVWNTVSSIKSMIDTAIIRKRWIVLAAHNFNEISKNDLTEILSYIQSKPEDKIDVVNWNYIYENFGEYTGPAVPTADALKAVENYKNQLEGNNSSDQNNQSQQSSQVSSTEKYPSSSKEESSSTPSNPKPTTSSTPSSQKPTTKPTSSNQNPTTNSTVASTPTESTTNSPSSTVESVNDQTSDTSSTISVATKQENDETQKPNNKLLIIIFIILFALLVSVVFLFILLKRKSLTK